MTFDIILTTFNRLEYTKRTIASLVSSGALEACARFIIVDNHSIEEGFEAFLNDMEHYQKVFVLRRPVNDGWATAVNDAIGLSRAPYVLISNNDVEYKPVFWESASLAFQEHPNIGILGVWRHTAHSYAGVSDGTFREMTDVPAVGWFLPKSAMEVVGGLEEKGPCATKGGNGEDSAYVNRMKAAGFLTGVCPEDIATHIDGY